VLVCLSPLTRPGSDLDDGERGWVVVVGGVVLEGGWWESRRGRAVARLASGSRIVARQHC